MGKNYCLLNDVTIDDPEGYFTHTNFLTLMHVLYRNL